MPARAMEPISRCAASGDHVARLTFRSLIPHLADPEKSAQLFIQMNDGLVNDVASIPEVSRSSDNLRDRQHAAERERDGRPRLRGRLLEYRQLEREAGVLATPPSSAETEAGHLRPAPFVLSTSAASRNIGKLLSDGTLVEQTSKQRNRIFLAPEIMATILGNDA